MVTKRKRRSQLARASWERQQVRRAERAARRRRLRRIITVVLVIVLAAVLAWWIAGHRPDSGSSQASGVDYAAVVDLYDGGDAYARPADTTDEGAR